MSNSDAKPKSPAPGSGERKVEFTTLSGHPIHRLYTPADLANQNPDETLGFPGDAPYTRGIYPTMYRGRFWTMRQYAGFGSAAESNQRYRYLLGKGQAGLSVAFDLPTQIGMDSDSPLALGEVGKVGVAIDSLQDMETLFENIPLEKVSTSMTINSTAAILLCLYVAVAKKQGADLGKLSGTVQNDILKEYIARGTYIYPRAPGDAYRYGYFQLVPHSRSKVEHHLHFRIPHSGSWLDGYSGSGLHPSRRHRLRAGRPGRRP